MCLSVCVQNIGILNNNEIILEITAHKMIYDPILMSNHRLSIYIQNQNLLNLETYRNNLHSMTIQIDHEPSAHDIDPSQLLIILSRK